MLSLRTPGFQGESVQFSPLVENKIAVAAVTHYGLGGSGRLYIHDVTPKGIQVCQHYDVEDSLFGVRWSQNCENQVYACCGDGSLRLFDLTMPSKPIHKWKEHKAEIVAIDTNTVDRRIVVTGSWDGTIKLWLGNLPNSVQTLNNGSNSRILTVATHYSSPNLLGYTSSDGLCKFWDFRSSDKFMSIEIPNQITCMNWSKSNHRMVYTADNNNLVYCYDIANLKTPLSVLSGHQLAVRSIKSSNSAHDLLATASYDMTSRIFDPEQHSCIRKVDLHSEFVCDVDWSDFGDGSWIASVGWDESLYIWNAF